MNLPVKYFFVGIFLTVCATVFCQKISIDKKTLKVTIESGDFKVGSLIAVEITHSDASKDSFTVAISGNQYANSVKFPSDSIVKSTDGTQTQYLLPLQVPDFDKSEIKIIRFNEKNEKQEERIYTYRNSGGLKFDVSTGFFATGLKDKVYVLKTTSATSNKIIEEESGNFRVGVGILAHIHSRWDCVVNLGISGGFELNNDSKIGYLAGVSVFFGHDRKFVVSGGLVMSKVKSLSKIYSVDQEVPSSVTVVPTVDKWGSGCFASLSYNF